jgi:hypothetical protein
VQEDINDLRRLVERLHPRRGSTEVDVARVALTAHELLENAVKLSVDANGTTELVTRNRAAAKDRAVLQRFAAEIEGAPDPEPVLPVADGARAEEVGFVFQDDVVEVHARGGNSSAG